jgi:hypothetical protein
MQRSKTRILVVIGSVIIIIAISTAVVYVLGLTIDKKPIAPQSVTSDIPKTTSEQNKKGDETFLAAMIALKNNDNINEAKKQLELAIILYKAANNQQGIDKVNAQYSIINHIPQKPTITPAQVR